MSTKLPSWRFVALWLLAGLFGLGVAAAGIAKLVLAFKTLTG